METQNRPIYQTCLLIAANSSIVLTSFYLTNILLPDTRKGRVSFARSRVRRYFEAAIATISKLI